MAECPFQRAIGEIRDLAGSVRTDHLKFRSIAKSAIICTQIARSCTRSRDFSFPEALTVTISRSIVLAGFTCCFICSLAFATTIPIAGGAQGICMEHFDDFTISGPGLALKQSLPRGPSFMGTGLRLTLAAQA